MTMSIDYLKVKANKKYRLISVPGRSQGIDTDGWPALNAVGECKWASSISGACMNFGGEDVLIPVECLIECSDKSDGIEDDILITIMSQNPEGVLKLLRGLWRMTKHDSVRNLMERGEFPIDTAPSLKPKAECEENWNEFLEHCKQSGMIVSE